MVVATATIAAANSWAASYSLLPMAGTATVVYPAAGATAAVSG
jgi:hypothetical protein